MKTKLNALVISLALWAGVFQTNAQVTNLGIAPAGGQSVLYWPVSTKNYVLQTVTNLSSTNWVTARDAFTVNAGAATNAVSSGFYRLLQTTNPPGTALIPAGWFVMGNYLCNIAATNDPDIADANPTNVYVSAFVMDVNLVCYGLWANVYAYATNRGYNFLNAGVGMGTNYPVELVDWYDCVKWCNARSQQAGLTPCYYTDADFTQLFQTNGETGIAIYQNLTANGYRLPTEAEWEKAARGGGIGLRFPWGDKISTGQAQYSSCTLCYSYDLGPDYAPSGPSPVGVFDVNGYGLNDMAGNVYEWCWDWYGTPYGQPTTINPTGPATGIYRVLRGGLWANNAASVRCASRVRFNPGTAAFGFRCVRGF